MRSTTITSHLFNHHRGISAGYRQSLRLQHIRYQNCWCYIDVEPFQQVMQWTNLYDTIKANFFGNRKIQMNRIAHFLMQWKASSSWKSQWNMLIAISLGFLETKKILIPFWRSKGFRLFNFVQNSPEVEHFKKELSSVYQ